MASELKADLEDDPESGAVGAGVGLHPREASEYIAELVDELATVARNSELPILAYLLDVAAHEAKTRAHELTDASHETDRLTESSS